MLNNNPGVALKVLLLSAAFSLAIKYVAPQFPIPATPMNALTMVLLPTGVLAAGLTWRMKPKQKG
jgi:hypothetical protein